MSLAILVPVLRRPQNVAPLLRSIADSTPPPYRVLFICDPGDRAEQDAIALAGGWMISPGGNYASKIHAGINATSEPLLFLGADDLRFRRHWLEFASAVLTGTCQVVGVNDGLTRARPNHATHFLMKREYALAPSIDGTPGPLCELYHHSFVDDELIATATKRGVYRYEVRARVDHHHWMNHRAPDDEIYKLGRVQFRQDRRVYMRRAQLWT